MKKLLIPALLAGAALAFAPQTALAAKKDAAPVAGTAVQGIGVANVEAAVAGSQAVRTAATQRPVTYKPQIDAYQARGQQAQAQLKPLYEKFERDSKAPNANRAALEQQAAGIQQIEESAQRELNEILRPVAYSEAYVSEQVGDKLNEAIQKAMAKSNVTLLLQPGAVVARANGYDLTDEIVTELNALIPNATLVPPQGWEPRQLREARAQQAAQQGGQPAAAAPAAPAGPQTEGR